MSVVSDMRDIRLGFVVKKYIKVLRIYSVLSVVSVMTVVAVLMLCGYNQN